MLYNLLTPTPEEWIMLILAFIIVFGGMGTGLTFLIIYIVKSLAVHASPKEMENIRSHRCPYTEEYLDREVVKDTGYYEPEKIVESVRVHHAAGGDYLIDKETVKKKVGGQWVPGDYKLERFSAKTLGYTILREYKKREEYQAETSWNAETLYDVETETYSLEKAGSLTPKQQKKMVAMCQKISTKNKRVRW